MNGYIYKVQAWYVSEHPRYKEVTFEARARYETLEEAIALGEMQRAQGEQRLTVRGGVTVWEVPPEGAGPEGSPEATAHIVHHYTYRSPPQESDEAWANHVLKPPRGA